jgi:hypothetical protein
MFEEDQLRFRNYFLHRQMIAAFITTPVLAPMPTP